LGNSNIPATLRVKPSIEATIQELIPFGGAINPRITAISANGSILLANFCGPTCPSDYHGYLWTVNTTVVPLDRRPGSTYSPSAAMSTDGTVVVGSSRYVAKPNEAFRWQSTGDTRSMTPLGFAPGDNESDAFAMNADGTVIAGWSSGPSGIGAAVWRPQTGMRRLPKLQGTAPNASLGVVGVTADGSRILGHTTGFPGASLMGLFWSGPDFQNVQALGRPAPPYDSAVPEAMSADGSVVVGYLTNASNAHQAFRWTAATGIQPLGFLDPNQTSSTARAVSADGKVITGVSGDQPFRWSSERRMQSIRSLLIEDAGLDLSNFETRGFWAASPDGTWIAGATHRSDQFHDTFYLVHLPRSDS
jgi:probable HAF family extracellular repeat protein